MVRLLCGWCPDAALGFHGEDAGDALVDALLGEVAVFDGVHEGIDTLPGIGWTEQEIAAGVNGVQRDLGAGVGIGHGAHLQAVGDDDAVEAELAAQEIGDDLVGKRGGLVVDLGADEVTDHDHVAVGGDAGLKRQKLGGAQLVEGFVHIDGAVVGIGAGVAVAGKMLEGGADAAIVETKHGGLDELGGLVEIVAVGAVADDGILGIGPNVGNGGEVKIEAEALHVPGDGVGVAVGGVGALVFVIEHGADVGGADGVHEPVDTAAFFVAGEDERDLAAALGIGEHALHLGFVFEVFFAVHDAADRHACEGGLHGFAGAGDDGFTGEMLGLDDEKLADFFIESHAGDGFLDEGVLVRSERFFWLLWRCGRIFCWHTLPGIERKPGANAEGEGQHEARVGEQDESIFLHGSASFLRDGNLYFTAFRGSCVTFFCKNLCTVLS